MALLKQADCQGTVNTDFKQAFVERNCQNGRATTLRDERQMPMFRLLRVPEILAGILPEILAGLRKEGRNEWGLAVEQRRSQDDRGSGPILSQAVGGGQQGVEAAAHALPVVAGPVQARATGTARERVLLDAHHRRQAVQDVGLGHWLKRLVAAHAAGERPHGGGEIEATQAVPDGRAGGPEGPVSASS